MTLAQCQKKCTKKTDSKGRPCVAIEWKDKGEAQKDSKQKQCALVWGCDYTVYWSGGSVFMRTEYNERQQMRREADDEQLDDGAETEDEDEDENGNVDEDERE